MRRWAIAGLAIAAAAAVLSFRPIYEPDLWWHLAQGREDAAGRLVRTNVFSFTHPDHRQHYTAWLYDLSAYGAWQALGGLGIQLLQWAFIAAAFGATTLGCRVRAPASAAAALLLLGFFVVEPRAIPRPHVLSFAGMALCALFVERARAARSARPLAWTVPLAAAWSNVHVECVFGVALVVIVCAAEAIRPSAFGRRAALRGLAIAAASLLATAANPYGFGLVAYLYENLSVPQVLTIAELQPPYLPAYRAYYAYVLAGAALLLVGWRSVMLSEVVVFALFATAGFLHLRLTPLLFFATAPMLAARLATLGARGVDPRAVLVTAFALALASSRIPLPLLARGFAVGTQAVAPPEFFSPGAIDFIKRSGLDGPVFNSHNLGGWLAWEGYPAVRVFQDSRLQAYPPEHFRRIIEASRSQQEWNAVVGEVDWAVLSVPRPNQLSGDGRFPFAEWAPVYEDEAVEIVVRRTGKLGALAAAGTAGGVGATAGTHSR